MLFADLVTPEAVAVIERYGSFGLVCGLVAVFTFRVIPRAIQEFKEQREDFTKVLEAQQCQFSNELKAERVSREILHKQCEDGHTAKTQAIIDLVSTITERRAGDDGPKSGSHRIKSNQPRSDS